MKEPVICKVVPAIVARHPEILNFPKPTRSTKRVEESLRHIRRRISNLVIYKIEREKL